MSKPPIAVTLEWHGDLRFTATSASTRITIDGDSAAGLSPVQALAISLAGCMAADVASILTKGRHPMTSLIATLVGSRAQSNPHRFLSFALAFRITGAAPVEAVERAIALSREKYCSVWHSMREDIQLTTSFEVLP